MEIMGCTPISMTIELTLWSFHMISYSMEAMVHRNTCMITYYVHVRSVACEHVTDVICY